MTNPQFCWLFAGNPGLEFLRGIYMTLASKQVFTGPEAKDPLPSSMNSGAEAYRLNLPLFFLGALLCLAGFAIYLSGILFSVVRLTLSLGDPFRVWNERIIWYSGVPCTLGLALSALDLAFLLP